MPTDANTDTVPGRDADSTHLVVMELPTGWLLVPPAEEDPADFVRALPNHVANDPPVAPSATQALFDRLAADHDSGHRVVCAAWTAQTVVGDVPDPASTAGAVRRIARPVQATFTVLHADAVVSDPEAAVVEAPQAVALTCGPATMSVAVVGSSAADQLLEVAYTVPRGPDRWLALIGRTPNLTVADTMVEMFHLMANTVDVVT